MNPIGIQPTQIVSKSPAQTQAIAAELATRLRGGEVIAIEGELGAGKTVFVRGIAQGLGIDPKVVSSPTFVISQEYSDPADKGLTLIHIDAYRLRGDQDLQAIGWEEVLSNPKIVVAVEWPSRIATALPATRIEVRIKHRDPHSRLITMGASTLKTESSAVLKSGRKQRRCRKCGTPIAENVPTFPFCSDRCRYADLGSWFSGGYRVSRPAEADDELNE
jgi:tRNA threonylcarbamoyladenosine biosynthesis protein TsaE